MLSNRTQPVNSQSSSGRKDVILKRHCTKLIFHVVQENDGRSSLRPSNTVSNNQMCIVEIFGLDTFYHITFKNPRSRSAS